MRHFARSRHTWQTSCCLWTCAHSYIFTHTPTHTRRSHLSVVLARADSNASNQLVEAVRLCGTPGLHHLQCICYINLGTSLPPSPSLLQLLRFVLNVVLLKTNLLPIIKIRAKQTAKRKAKNSRKNRKNSPEKNKVKFHKSFCGNRWKSSKKCLHICMYVRECVCVLFFLCTI